MGDAVLDGRREGLLAQHRAAERVALQRVLVGDVERLEARASPRRSVPVVDEDLARGVGRRVERDQHLQSGLGADHRHALMRCELGRAGEGQVPGARELDQRARQPVDAHGRVAFDAGRDPQRLDAEEIAGGVDRIAADVVEPPAADLRLVAHVRRIGERIAEKRLDRLGGAERSILGEVAGSLPPGRMAGHERLGHELAGAAPGVDQLLGLRGGQRDRLLAEHVLAGLHGADAPGHVQVVGQRVVDRLDVGIGQQGLVAPIGARDAELRRDTVGLGLVARGDRGDARVAATLHAGNDLPGRDKGGAEHPPVDDPCHADLH